MHNSHDIVFTYTCPSLVITRSAVNAGSKVADMMFPPRHFCLKTQLYHFCEHLINHHSVDQAGSERTEAGESAPSRLEDSPRPGRAKCELCETLQDLIMGAGEEASLNLPCLLILASSWIARPSRSYSSELQATRGTLCCSAILPF